jgi:TatD DNase family protein
MIDSHCHLAGEEFEADLPAVIERAQAAGVAGALVILAAGDEAERRRAGRVRSLWPAIRFSVGIHPHQAGEYAEAVDAGVRTVESEIATWQAAAVGEIGLDYHYDFSPRDVQQDVFRGQLQLARRCGLPVVIHTREAADDTFAILEEHEAATPVVFHCFTGDVAMAERALRSGAWLSFAGIVTFPRAGDLRDVARMVPADRFLVETDAPYLAPVPHRGRRNEPAFVAKVVETLAEVRGSTPEDIAASASANFTAVFGRPPAAG